MQRVLIWLLCAGALLGTYLCSSGLLRLHEVFTQTPAAPSAASSFASHRDYGHQARLNGQRHKLYDRFVVVLIDALRADMVLGSDVMYNKTTQTSAIDAVDGQDGHTHVKPNELNEYMPYTYSLVASGQALGYVGYASIPTVTMPRLKALVTGKAPAFIDILKNFNSAALTEENLIELLVEAGNRIVFYGDDTWLKLFPTAFQRTDGTSGFFTRDTVEVDDNVTRHLADELDPTMTHAKSSDWDVLVMHYLGLDHVGHLRGPRSSMMHEKLLEMDVVIQRVFDSVRQQDAKRKESNRNALPTLVLLCSDHGMSEVGNHGGATVEESSALLLFLRGDGEKMSTKNHQAYKVKRMQVDLVPTIASLFNLRIPSYSTGILLDEVVKNANGKAASSKQYLYALLDNLQQLYTLAAIKFHVSSLRDFDERYGEAIKQLEQKVMSTEMVNDDELIRLIREACEELQGRVAKNDGSDYNERMIFMGLGLLFCSIVVARKWIPRQQMKNHLITTVLCCGSLLHIVSLSSSSSIENEHATAFFLVTTLLCVFAIRLLQQGNRGHVTQSHRYHQSKSFSSFHSDLALIVVLMVITRILRSRNQVINFGRLNGLTVDKQTPGNEFAADDSVSILSTASLFSSSVLPLEVHFGAIFSLVMWKVRRLVRQQQAQMTAGFVSYYLGVAMTTASFTIGIVASTLCNRISRLEETQSIDLKQLWNPMELNADDYARIVYLVVILLSILMMLLRDRRMKLLIAEMIVWVLVSLLQRDNHLATVTLLSLQCFFITEMLQRTNIVISGSSIALITVWICQTAFFALGNSHLVTTIDISQSYHGLSGYSQSIVGLLTFVNVFSGPLVCLVNLPQWIHTIATKQQLQRIKSFSEVENSIAIEACWAIFTYQTLRFIVYTIIVYFMRFHLFIWSVFAPRMLYEVVHTFMFIGVVIIFTLSYHPMTAKNC